MNSIFYNNSSITITVICLFFIFIFLSISCAFLDFVQKESRKSGVPEDKIQLIISWVDFCCLKYKDNDFYNLNRQFGPFVLLADPKKEIFKIAFKKISFLSFVNFAKVLKTMFILNKQNDKSLFKMDDFEKIFSFFIQAIESCWIEGNVFDQRSKTSLLAIFFECYFKDFAENKSLIKDLKDLFSKLGRKDQNTLITGLLKYSQNHLVKDITSDLVEKYLFLSLDILKPNHNFLKKIAYSVNVFSFLEQTKNLPYAEKNVLISKLLFKNGDFKTVLKKNTF